MSRRKVDRSKVIEAVESGRLSREVMEEYGLGNSENHNHSGRKGGQGQFTSPPLGDVKVGKRGSLVLPRSLVEALGYDDQATFVARKTKVGFLLKPSSE